MAVLLWNRHSDHSYQQQKDKLILEMKILTLQVLGPTLCGFFVFCFVFIVRCSQYTVQSKKLRGTLIDHSPIQMKEEVFLRHTFLILIWFR